MASRPRFPGLLSRTGASWTLLVLSFIVSDRYRWLRLVGTLTDADGLPRLDPLHVAAWGGIYQGGVITGNLYGGL